MTYEELKAEAKAQGYNLVKAKPYTRMLPCTCGSKRRSLWHCPKGNYLVCNRCGKRSRLGINERQAREFWNEMIIAESEAEE